ncbi:diguanylate cyclase [Vibrio sp. SM6]|uniref:diguanylate cyclase n=1 Tax=Vibrio agarilyticus TaxID=2726741 RepID=A0A7X8TRL8_9VIBR|nr:diguanylate cyclase [Vibrio agarilyticus]NLS13337.1 diguanylate cyclase [Vibrio agarilyticus]
MSAGSSMRILLVDDVAVVRMQLAIRLEQLGHEVKAVDCGRQALESYEEFDPELVLLDVCMPEIDGFEVSRRIRSEFPDWVPIIFLSGYDEPEMIATAIEAGGDDYLIKPVDKLILQSKLIAMQRIAQMRRELKQTTQQLHQINKKLQQQANEDGLTKLYNRRFIDNQLDDLIAWHGRHQMPMGLIMLDVDHFKAFNDNYGHIQGDQCLQAIAQILDALFTRTGEYVGRYGGEEFVILLGSINTEKLAKQARRIREAIHQLAYPHQHSQVSDIVTASLGVLSLMPRGNESRQALYEMADSALYQAKTQGRDQHVLRIEGEGQKPHLAVVK